MQNSKVVEKAPTIGKFKNFWLRGTASKNQKLFHSEELQLDDVDFIMCSFFCAIAVATLLIFSISALVRGNVSFAFSLFGFALVTIAGIGAIWISGQDWLAKHFTTLLMAVLCIYLFYTGGTSGTGPVIFLIFPLVALFLQGNYIGAYSVISLLILSSFIYAFNLFGFDNSQYTDAYINRILGVFVVISALAYAFSHFKDKAERAFIKSQEELKRNTVIDKHSGLANRVLLEKILLLELNRVSRHFRPSSLMLLNANIQLAKKYQFIGLNHVRVSKNIADIFNRLLRGTDIAGRWSDNSFLIILPETMIDQAQEISRKLISEFNNYQSLYNDQTIELAMTAICNEIFPEDVKFSCSEIINKMQASLDSK